MEKHLVENEKNEKTLGAWIGSRRFPHGILIEGNRGTGKRTFGTQLAAVILCTGENTPCGECSSCKKMEKEIHPDFHLVKGSGGARSFHISQVREIREEAWVAPNDGNRKVFLLVNGEEMSVQAQNALLKLIEEPPEGVYFILTCENRNQMLTTIRSRMTSLTMTPPSIDKAAEFLTVEHGIDAEKARQLAEYTQGNLGQAITALSQQESDSSQGQDLWQALKAGRPLGGLEITAEYEKDREGFLQLLEDLRSQVTGELLSLSPAVPGGLSLLQHVEILDIIEDVTRSVHRNVNMLLLVTLLPSAIGKIISNR